MRLAGMLPLLALLVPAAALGQDAAPSGELRDATPEDVEAWKDVLQRYQDRMEEFSADVREIVDLREQQERERIGAGYAALQDEMDQNEAELRKAAIDRFEAFLAKYPADPYSAHVMFRLADLYFEQAEEDWQVASDEYSRLEVAAAADPAVELPEMPLKDYSKPIDLYQRIIREHPDYRFIDGAWYMLGYTHYDDLSRQHDSQEAVQEFQTLVERYPDSQFAVDASMRLGEVHFDDNEIEEAIPYYQRVVDAGQDHRLYDKGLYKLAWSDYKLGRYRPALDLFTRLLDFSEQAYRESGVPSAVSPEAIEYMAIIFSDLADLQGGEPVRWAEDWFDEVGDRDYTDDVFKKLARVLIGQARYESAITTYEYIQQRWPDDPDDPAYQQKVAQLYMNLPIPDEAASARAQTALTERYGEGSRWAQANRDNPDAIAVASRLIERSLGEVAKDYHIRAQSTQRPEDFAAAADKYREYLAKFPFADDYYEIQWYMADSLYNAGRYQEAGREYEQLLKSTGHPYTDGARWQLVKVWSRILTNRYGSVAKLPDGAVVSSQVPRADGTRRPVYKLTAEHEAFIAACDAIKDVTFTDPAFADSLEHDRAALHYLPAQVLYLFGHYDEARPRLDEIVKRFPDHDEAAYAAALIVNSYQEEGDLEMVRMSTGRFATMRLGSSAELSGQKAAEFASLQEGAAFKLALALVDKGDRQAAADAFLKFIDDFPGSDNVPLALFNAANSLDIIGQKARANELFERYINTWPRDQRSKTLYYRIASNYAEILELDKAVDYYERLFRFFPGYVDAPSALYMAGFLRTGMGDHEGAAENFQEYARRYPDQADAEDVFWLAGEQWEQVGDREASRFYKRYVDRRSEVNPDHALAALHWLAGWYERTGDRRNAERTWRKLIDTFRAAGGAGAVGPAGRSVAAEAAFRDVWAAFQSFKELKLTGNQQHDAELLTQTKKSDLQALEAQALALVQEYQDFEYSSAALYVVGAAYLAYSDMLFNAPPPPDFTEEMIEIYQNQLADLAEPLQEKAVARLEANLEKARAEKRSSEWIDRTIELLHEIDPSTYPLEKPEVGGTADSVVIPPVLPISAGEAPGAQP